MISPARTARAYAATASAAAASDDWGTDREPSRPAPAFRLGRVPTPTVRSLALADGGKSWLRASPGLPVEELCERVALLGLIAAQASAGGGRQAQLAGE